MCALEKRAERFVSANFETVCTMYVCAMQRPSQTRQGLIALIALGAHNPEKSIAENHLTSNCRENTKDFLGRKLEKDSLYPL